MKMRLSPKNDVAHTEKLLNILQRRLEILREKQAQMGDNTPTHFILEIEQTEAEIARLKGTVPASPYRKAARRIERLTNCPQCKATLKPEPPNAALKLSSVIYATRHGPDLECGYCGAIIPNQFPEAPPPPEPPIVEEANHPAPSSSNKSQSWLSKIFRRNS